MDLETLYHNNLALLKEASIKYTEYAHEPVLTYAKAAEIRARFDLKGIESKSLFLQLKDKRYCMFVSVEGNRLDTKKIKSELGSKPRICSDEELTRITGCVPKCAVPFGHPAQVTLIIDQDIFEHEQYLYSPGPPGKTMLIQTADIPQLLEIVPNQIVFYSSTSSMIN